MALIDFPKILSAKCLFKNIVKCKKDKSRFISLSSQNNETIDHIIRTLLEFKRFLTDHTQVKLVFLEVPIYSLKNWNEHCKHKDPSTFKD